MTRKLQGAPVGYTCPQIDKIIEGCGEIENRLNLSLEYLGDIVDALEVLRTANDKLRGWGENLEEELSLVEEECEALVEEVEELNGQVEEKLGIIAELEYRISSLEK